PSKYFVEYQLVFGNDGTMKSYAELKDLYVKNGIDGTKLVIPYCQSAVRSAVTTFVLKELLGYKNVKNYDGSWIEWSYEVKNNKYPVEIGK
ncbi:MAG: sulfurtransferase, partial [Fusobacteriaceae bacterium]